MYLWFFVWFFFILFSHSPFGLLDAQNVVTRVTNLPLVSSTYDIMSSVYINTKDNYPYLKSVCEIAEKGLKTIAAVTVTTALPIFQKLEPHIALANNYACVGLDRIEERLPILNQSSDEVVASAKGAVVGAKDAVTTTMSGARDSVTQTITGVVDKTRGAVNESINTVLGSRVVQIMSNQVENALTKSEFLVDQYLPLTEEELEKAKLVEGSDVQGQKPSYYVRLGSLSTKLRARSYYQAMSRVENAKCKSQETISQLHSTLSLIEFARENMNNANQNIQDKLCRSWMEWKKCIGQSDSDELPCAEHIESRTLAVAHNLTQQLQVTCHTLIASIQGLPQNVQDQASYIVAMAGDVGTVFHSSASFKEVSAGLLTSSKGQLHKMKESLDEVMDYLVNNTPLNWLVGPFYPQLPQSPGKLDNPSEEQNSNQEDQQLHPNTN
uniref:Perilipin n=1 Tax=Ornithorhynchus anatinus TaxID=9258 RepID=F6YLN8_ORNAN